MIQNTGFTKEKIESDHYILGGGNVMQKILQPNSYWEDFLPKFEPQLKRDIETYNCTGFNVLKPVAILIKRLGLDFNGSERCLGIFAGTYPPGNSPHKVCEALRQQGVVKEEVLPFSDDIRSVNEYYSFKGALEGDVRKLAKQFLEKFTYKHEWVFGEDALLKLKQDAMMEALMYSPLSASVTAWQQNADGLYVDNGLPNNHLTTIIGGVRDSHWICDDSYLNDGTDIKLLTWDFNFETAKRHYIAINDTPPSFSLWDRFINLIKWQ